MLQFHVGLAPNWAFADIPIVTAQHYAHLASRRAIRLGDGYTKGAIRLRTGGCLADIAPTVLDLMELPKPVEMTGESLIAD